MEKEQSSTPRKKESDECQQSPKRNKDSSGWLEQFQKGEMEAPSAEVSKAAASMSKSDVKKFAKTKHKGLPNKVDVKEGHMNKTCKAGYYYCYTDKKCKLNSERNEDWLWWNAKTR